MHPALPHRFFQGDGTVYGWTTIIFPDGSEVKGAGQTKASLIAAGAMKAENCQGSITGDIEILTE